MRDQTRHAAQCYGLPSALSAYSVKWGYPNCLGLPKSDQGNENGALQRAPQMSASEGPCSEAKRQPMAPDTRLDGAPGAPPARDRSGYVQRRAWSRRAGCIGRAGCDCAILRRPPTQDGRRGRSVPRMGEWGAVWRAWAALTDHLARHHHQLPDQPAHICVGTNPAASLKANRRTCRR